MLRYEFETIPHSSVGDMDPSYYSIFSGEDWQDLTGTDGTHDSENLLLQMIYKERMDVPCHVDHSLAPLGMLLFREHNFAIVLINICYTRFVMAQCKLMIISQGH